MAILVTGGTGFTGSHLVRRLLLRGEAVRALDNQPGLFADELRELGAEVIIGSVTDERVVRDAVRGCHTVHHLAAAFRRLDVPASHYAEVNEHGTGLVCKACVDFGVQRLVYCSTCGVHGNVTTRSATEDSPIAPADYYQSTKYDGEVVVQRFVENGLDAAIVRPTAIYGPGDPGRFLMLFRLCRKRTFLMFGDGRIHYHPVHIENLCDVFELAAATPGISGQAFLGADERSFELNELVREVARSLGNEITIRHLPFAPLRAAASVCAAVCKPLGIAPPIFPRRVDWFRQHRSFEIAKARTVLGYAPRIDLPSGLAQTASWYRRFGYLDGQPLASVRLPEPIPPQPLGRAG
jgi:nucleoside-diphosphate-sugar epimerase